MKKAQVLVKTREFNKNLKHTAYDFFQLFYSKEFCKNTLEVMTVLLTFGSYLCRYIDHELKILAP